MLTAIGMSPMPFVVTEIQSTPNPNAAKFVLDRPIVAQPTSFFSAAAAQEHPVAAQLFGIPGVATVLLLGDFVTVNKKPDARWDSIKPRVQEILQGA